MTDINKGILLGIIILSGGLIYLLAPILMPFISAAILAYIADPLVDRLEKHMPRTLAVSIVFIVLSLLAILLLIVLVPMLQKQFLLLADKLPLYLERAQDYLLPVIKEQLGIDADKLDMNVVRHSLTTYWKAAGGIAANIIGSLSNSGLVLVGWVANFLLMLVVTFYLLRDWDILVAKVHALIPRKHAAAVAMIAREADDVLGAFFRGQLLVMLVLASVYTIGLMLMGLDMALLIGSLAGLVSFVPYLGFIVGIGVAGIAAVMQFQEAMPLLYVGAVFLFGQMLEGMLLTPLLVGDKIGLHPVAVIFAVLAGGQLFGFVGVLLALPVAAVIAVLLRHLHDQYTQSELYGEK